MATLFSRITFCLLALATIAWARTEDHQTERRKIVVYGDTKQHAWLGVELQDVTASLKERKELGTSKGAYVIAVIDESPAAKAGIERGDVIVKFDGATIDDSDDLMEAVRKTPPKTEVKIELLRKSERKSLAATLGKQRAPEAYSYNFRMPRMPRMPQMPRMPSLPRQRFGSHFDASDATFGLELQSLTRQLAEYLEVPGGRGLLVAEVDQGSAAEKAGFKAGDVILKLNGASVRDIDDLHEELADMRDTTAKVEIVRKGKAVTLSLRVEKEEEDDEEEEGDDSSIDLWTPHGGHTWQGEHPSLRETFIYLRETFRTLEERLREKVQHLHDRFRSELSEL